MTKVGVYGGTGRVGKQAMAVCKADVSGEAALINKLKRVN